MIHQMFMLVFCSQHLEREDRRQQLGKNSQKCLTAFQRWLNQLFCDTRCCVCLAHAHTASPLQP